MADTTDAGTNWNATVEYLRGLAQIVREAGLSILEIESGGSKLTLRSARPQLVAAPEASAFAPVLSPGQNAPTSTVAHSAPEEPFVPVVSPMVGVWYRAPSPADPDFVEVGDRVEVGQTIGLVEAMKVFNEITAETSGIVAQIPAQTGQLVETGQPLLMLRR